MDKIHTFILYWYRAGVRGLSIEITIWDRQVMDMYRENMELVHSQYPKLDTPTTLENIYPLRETINLDVERKAEIVPVGIKE